MSARLIAPSTLKAGESAEVKLTILHPMELGTRRLDDGTVAARNVIESLDVTYENESVIALKFSSGIAANPYWSFSFVPQKSGTLLARWRDSRNVQGEASARITIS